jgi:hypothetical protein
VVPARLGSHAGWPLAVVGGGRAFGACCFAGKLRSPAHPSDDPGHPAQLGGLDPTRAGGVPLLSVVGVVCPVQMPLRGEWSGQAEWTRFVADLRPAPPAAAI